MSARCLPTPFSFPEVTRPRQITHERRRPSATGGSATTQEEVSTWYSSRRSGSCSATRQLPRPSRSACARIRGTPLTPANSSSALADPERASPACSAGAREFGVMGYSPSAAAAPAQTRLVRDPAASPGARLAARADDGLFCRRVESRGGQAQVSPMSYVARSESPADRSGSDPTRARSSKLFSSRSSAWRQSSQRSPLGFLRRATPRR